MEAKSENVKDRSVKEIVKSTYFGWIKILC